MGGKPKISKGKGIQICVDLLYAGQSRKEILQHITENYKASEKTVDNWLKEARPLVSERVAAAKSVQDMADKEAIEASAKRLNLSRERLMEELAKIAYGDIRKVLTIDGGLRPASDWDDETAGSIAGIESYDIDTKEGEILGTVRKVKSWDKIRAIEALNKMLGYNAAEKKDLNVNLTDGPIVFE